MADNRSLKKEQRQAAFLAAYREWGYLTHACRAADIDPSLPKYWFRTDAAFKAKFNALRAEATETLEREARRRAVEGLKRYKFASGKPCYIRCKPDEEGAIEQEDDKGNVYYVRHYYEHEYSDILLIFLLKGEKPNKYRDRQEVQHRGPGGPVDIRVAGPKTSDEQLAAVVQQLLQAAARRKAADNGATK